MNLMHLRRLWLAGVVLVAVLALLPFSFHAERHLETATRIEGSEAGKVPQELATRFHSPFVDRVVLVIQGLLLGIRTRVSMHWPRLKRDYKRNRVYPESSPILIFATRCFWAREEELLF